MKNQNPPSNPISSYSNPNYASDYPSPSTPAAPLPLQIPESSTTSSSSIFNGLHRQANNSSADFQNSAASGDCGVRLSGEPFALANVDMGPQDDLLSVFLELQKLGGIDDQGTVGGSINHGGDGETAKNSRGRPRNSDLVENFYEPNKALTSDDLSEIRAVDPKRVKRILANRQSAARSKERKARYLVELERKVQALQLEATNLTAQVRIYQRDTSGLTAENAELKIRLQVMEQQAQLRDALNEALHHEVERLKIATGEIKTPSESYTLGGARSVPYSPFVSPSNLHYSPLTSPSTMQTASYSPAAASSPRTTNLFPIPKQSVPVISQLPPLHSSRSGLSDRRFRRLVNPPERNDPLGRLQGIDTSNR